MGDEYGKTDTTQTVGHPSNEGVRRGHAEHHRIAGDRSPHSFPKSEKAPDCFCGTKRSGTSRVSGKAGAHRIGKK